MSSDRILAVRVFEGELERMKNLSNGQYDPVEKVVRRYLQQRINDMTTKKYQSSRVSYR